MKSFLTFFALFSILSTTGFARTADEVVSLMRSHQGKDKTLNAVETIRYQGTISFPDGESGTFTVAFKKPFYQLIEIQGDKTIIRRGIDGFNGYVYQKDKVTGKDTRGVMNLETYSSMQIEAIENLYFYKGSTILPMEVKVINENATTEDGKPAIEIKFTHPYGFSYTRFVDPKTGEVFASVNQEGTRIVEEGDQTVSGIRFPKKLTTFTKDGEVANFFTLDKVEVNAPIPDEYFSYKKD